MHSTDPKRPPGTLDRDRQDSIDAAVMAGPSISRIKIIFSAPSDVVDLLHQYRTARYSKPRMAYFPLKINGFPDVIDSVEYLSDSNHKTHVFSLLRAVREVRMPSSGSASAPSSPNTVS